MDFSFTETQKNEIIKKWSDEHYSKILNDIGIYSQKWGLTDFIFIEAISSQNILLLCKSRQYGDCVLKMYGEMWEYNAYCEYGESEKFCRLYEFDLETRVMLIERIIPGTTLKDEPSLEKRLSIFSELFNNLHIEPKKPEKSILYLKLMQDAMEAVKNREDAGELYTHALKANELVKEISSVYDKKVLLHWDLKNDNILLDKNRKYRIIDPFGFIGDPIFEVGRYISKECSDAISGKRSETVGKITDYFETALKIPKRILTQCYYIDVVLMKCLIVQLLGGTVCLDDEKFDVRLAETILNDIG